MNNTFRAALFSLVVLCSTALGPSTPPKCKCSEYAVPNLQHDSNAGGQKGDDFGGSHCNSTYFGNPFCTVGIQSLNEAEFEDCSIDGTVAQDGNRYYISFEPCAPQPVPQCAMAPKRTQAGMANGHVTDAKGVCQCDAEGLVKNQMLNFNDNDNWQQCTRPNADHADRCRALSSLGSLLPDDDGGGSLETCPGWERRGNGPNKDGCIFRKRNTFKTCTTFCGEIGAADGSPDAGLWTCVLAAASDDDFKCILENDFAVGNCRFRTSEVCICKPPNECSCDNGFAAVGSACVVHETKQCDSCSDGYELDDATQACYRIPTTITRTTSTAPKTTTKVATAVNPSIPATFTPTTPPGGGGGAGGSTEATAATTKAADAAGGNGSASANDGSATTPASSSISGGGANGGKGGSSNSNESGGGGADATTIAGGVTTAAPSQNGDTQNGGVVAGVVVGVLLVAIIAVLVVLRKYLPALRKGAYADQGSNGGRESAGDSIMLSSFESEQSMSATTVISPRKIKVKAMMTFEVTETSIA